MDSPLPSSANPGGQKLYHDDFSYQDGKEVSNCSFRACFRYIDSYGIDKDTGERSWLRSLFCCYSDLCSAQACCLYNLLFAPIVLIFHSIRIYILQGCLAVHFRRGFLTFCCFCCRWLDWTCVCFGCICNCCAWLYHDRQFPPCPASLGLVGGDSAAGGSDRKNADAFKSAVDTVWIRASQFGRSSAVGADGSPSKRSKSLRQDELSGPRMVLYKDGVSATDILQGAIGDCWLMAAFSCLAEVPGAIDNLFITKEYDPRGKYVIQLFDGTLKNGTGAWRRFTIDDYIPCEKGIWESEGIAKPKFSQPNGNEMWVILLEKAFAKLCGSYAQLEGGSTIWALKAMTGDHCRWYDKDTKGGCNWRRSDFLNLPDDPSMPSVCPHCLRPVARDKRNGTLKPTEERLSSDEMFDTLLRYKNRRSVLCASGVEANSELDGLITGHAYSILDVVRVKAQSRTGSTTLKLILIRNPWGTGGGWSGDWSNTSPKWTEFPDLKAKLLPDATEGAFWMAWEDYCDRWKRLGIADRTLDINSLHFNYNQEEPCIGPTKGCLVGCFNYWVWGLGCRRLYCPKVSSESNVALDGAGKPICCGCSKATIVDRI